MSRTALVILGATGDLAKKKLLPSLTRLCMQNKIDESTVVVGSGRTALTEEAFRSRFSVPDKLRKRLHYHAGLFGLKGYVDSLGTFDKIVVFCALPPSVYVETAKALAQEGFGRETILIIEKPFGHNLETAQQLNQELVRFFPEENLFRIDHYLAKEAVRNLLTFRFANPVFRHSWDSRSIESIHISALETIGAEGRGAYFDQAGTIRDMVQNHLMQMLALTTMEPPASLHADAIIRSKRQLLAAVTVERSWRAQYQGYREEVGVAPESTTETYAELELSIHNERWMGCPIYIRAGKCCAEAGAEMVITFRATTDGPFKGRKELPRNRIILKIQPAAGVLFDLATRLPGSEDSIEGTTLNFCYSDVFTHSWVDGYEKLLLDAVLGDRSLFVDGVETELAWKIVDPIVGQGPLTSYSRGMTPSLLKGVDWPGNTGHCS